MLCYRIKAHIRLRVVPSHSLRDVSERRSISFMGKAFHYDRASVTVTSLRDELAGRVITLHSHPHRRSEPRSGTGYGPLSVSKSVCLLLRLSLRHTSRILENLPPMCPTRPARLTTRLPAMIGAGGRPFKRCCANANFSRRSQLDLRL